MEGRLVHGTGASPLEATPHPLIMVLFGVLQGHAGSSGGNPAQTRAVAGAERPEVLDSDYGLSCSMLGVEGESGPPTMTVAMRQSSEIRARPMLVQRYSSVSPLSGTSAFGSPTMATPIC